MHLLLIAAWIIAFDPAAVPQPAQVQPNPTGTWKTTANFGNRTRVITIKLKLELNQVTGTIVGRNGRESPIKNAQYQDGQISFEVIRGGWNGDTSTTKYTGQVSGNAIKGKSESDRSGQILTRDWDARRAGD